MKGIIVVLCFMWVAVAVVGAVAGGVSMVGVWVFIAASVTTTSVLNSAIRATQKVPGNTPT